MQPAQQRPSISPTLRLLLLPLLLHSPLAPCTEARAQTEPRSTSLYRCGPEGRDLRDSPCPEAAGRPAQSVYHDQPSAAQTREARERAAGQQRQADALERERLTHQARDRPAPPSGIRHRGEPAVGAASAPAAKKLPDKKNKSDGKTGKPKAKDKPAKAADAARR
jgi:hypothetical protein